MSIEKQKTIGKIGKTMRRRKAKNENAAVFAVMYRLLVAGKVPRDVTENIISMVIPRDKLRPILDTAIHMFEVGMSRRSEYNQSHHQSLLTWSTHVFMLNQSKDCILKIAKIAKHLVSAKDGVSRRSRYTQKEANKHPFVCDEWYTRRSPYLKYLTPLEQEIKIENSIKNDRLRTDGIDSWIQEGIVEFGSWL
jgi:hypothetical protein